MANPPVPEWLDSEEFEAYLYAYRTAPASDQAVVIAQFEAIKRFIAKTLAEGKP